MNKKSLARLALLLTKSIIELTDAEHAELTDLKAKALAENIKLDAEFVKTYKDAEDDPAPVSEEELSAVVTKSLNEALTARGIDQGKIIEAIKAAAPDNVNTADVKAAVEAAVKSANSQGEKVNVADIVAQVTAAVRESNRDVVTVATFTKALTDFAASQQRAKSIVQFPDNSDPGLTIIEHRSGNLTVAQKQLLNVIMRKDMNDGIKADQNTLATRNGAKALAGFRQQGYKALTTGVAGSGQELIPSDLSSELQMRLYLESAFAAAMVSNEVQMPTDTFKFPMVTTRTPFYTGTEAPATDPQDGSPGTAQILLDAQKLIGIAKYSYEAEEDAIIAILPMLMNDMSASAAASLEDALINGDITPTHQDNDTELLTPANVPATLFPGIRKLCRVGTCEVSTAAGGLAGTNGVNLLAMKKFMGKYGVKPSELIYLVGPKGYNDILGVDATLTVDKVGNAAYARILTGAAGFIWGVPIVVSEKVREDVDTTGVNSVAGPNDKGLAILIHKPSWILGVRRQFLVETDEDKRRQIRMVIASFRRAWVPKETLAPTRAQAVVGRGHTA